MAAQSKAQILNEIHTLLKKRFKPQADRPAKMTVLEAVVYGVCHEGTTREQANQAISRYKDDFFDWNEVRVSTIEEVQSALAGLPDGEPKAQRIRRFLRQLFEKTYGFTLEALTKKPLKESLKALKDYEAFTSDYVEATVIQQALGGHAMPVDGPARRVLERLGIVESAAETSAIRGLLERAVPKNKGAEFLELVEELAHQVCTADDPDCPHCELRKLCPTAQSRKEEAAAASKVASAQAKAAAKEAAKEKEKEIARPAAKPAPKAAAPAALPVAKAKTGRLAPEPEKPAKSTRPAAPEPPSKAKPSEKEKPRAAAPEKPKPKGSAKSPPPKPKGRAK